MSTELLSQTSALLSSVAYPAADAAIALSAVYFVVRNKRALSLQLASPFSHIASALLVVLAASHYAGWAMTLSQVAALALPLLLVHPLGYTIFQLANALSIYRLLSVASSPLQSVSSVAVHIFLVLANLNPSSRALLASIVKNVSFAQIRELGKLQKLRKLTVDDLWPLPERYHLRNAYSELAINTAEPLFFARAVIRMVWKPMIPILITDMLFQLLPILKAVLNGYIYECLDSPDSSIYYKAYMAAAGIILVELLASQKRHLEEYADLEKSRVKNILKLELNHRYVGYSYEWDPKYVEYTSGDSIEDIYFNVKTVKMFGWEDMYLDPKYKQGRKCVNELPWYAPLVRFGLKLVEIARALTTDLSMYVTIAYYLQSLSATDNTMTNSRLLEMADHIRTLRSNILSVYYNIIGISKIAYFINMLERLFRCEKFDTISHVYRDESSIAPSLIMDSCNFRWGKRASILRKVSLNATGDDLIAVVGKTGSGKTSLLLAMCREMEMTKGSGTVVGRIGYLEQSPWIMNDTMRANVIFGREFDEDYFWKVVHACALTQDMESWPDKDLTLIGERGINISGGQRARLALARTVYSQADVYILDDPLSAVDAHVKRHILDNVLLSSGLLGDKLRIIATHSESMLPFCNQIVTVCDKTVSVVIQKPKEHTYVAPTAIEATAASNSASENAALDDVSDKPAVGSDAELATTEEEEVADTNSAKEQTLPEKRTLLDNAKYVFSLCGWHIIAAVVVSASIRPLAKFILEGYNIAALKENAKSSAVSHDAVLWYLKICLLKSATDEVLSIVEDYVSDLVSSDKIEEEIQAKFVRSILFAPLSSKHSQTSSIIKNGSLMIRLFGVESHYTSRYISDKNEDMRIDGPEESLDLLSTMISTGIRDTGKLMSLFSVIAQSHLTKYKVTSGEMNLLQGDLTDLIYNISSLVEIPNILRKYSDKIGTFRQFSDLEPEAPYIVDDCRVPSEWPHSGNIEFKNLSVKYGADQEYALKNLNVSIRPGEKIGIVGRTGAGKSTLAKVIFRLLNKNVEGSVEIDSHDTAKFGVGDFRPKLGIIPQESAMIDGTVKRNLDPLNEFTIEDIWAAMIKCGVVDLIKTERKHIVKSAKASGVSSDDDEDEEDDDNEDEDEKADRLRWESAGFLMRVVLYMFMTRKEESRRDYYPKIGINKQVSRDDNRFSSGQRQLFSLCRLLMRKSKVLVLDEATAEVDLETDGRMQELIRNEFSDCTVLTIAHRLDTVMNSDRIIVMEKGEIAEIGPPQELIAKGGMFAELVKANEF
ncbi:ATP-binding cassette glutathione S-conjugate transporter ycf1 [Coemansia sp. BCRC 34301]|nr:ATP-binding cassette glutathione S-conjugate transporter ycf1 [Coemansia sp. BCRC 34301]